MLAPVRIALILVFAAGSGAELARGQQPLAPGSTVRLTLHGEASPVTGVLSSLSSAVWTVSSEDGQVTQVAPADLASAELLVARRNTVRGGLIGGGVGLVGGLLLAATADDECGRDSTGLCDEIVDAGVKTPALIWTPVAGAALGALVGSLVTSSRWVPALVSSDVHGANALLWSIPLGP